MKIAVCWFRRDLRLEDNKALYFASKGDLPILPLFIFDQNILDELSPDDSRVQFIHESILGMSERLKHSFDSGIHMTYGKPLQVWKELIDEFDIQEVYFNEDYEPYGIQRDEELKRFWEQNSIQHNQYSDHVLFKPGTVLKADGKPYTVFTPFKNKALDIFSSNRSEFLIEYPLNNSARFIQADFIQNLKLKGIGFTVSKIKVAPFNPDVIKQYHETRDIPSKPTSRIGPHLRFGTLSIRQIIKSFGHENETYLSELIWREFFIHILFHFPHVNHRCFKDKYEAVPWKGENEDFKRWCLGETGIPLVDAGMKELVKTGFMHNRVRMICASFLVKNLMIDWRLGEAFFAKHLLDYELASNNGNWQWSAGCGCDSAPYFRVFNPESQLKKFDPQGHYINTWLPEYQSLNYPAPVVDLKESRKYAIDTYKQALS